MGKIDPKTRQKEEKFSPFQGAPASDGRPYTTGVQDGQQAPSIPITDSPPPPPRLDLTAHSPVDQQPPTLTCSTQTAPTKRGRPPKSVQEAAAATQLNVMKETKVTKNDSKELARGIMDIYVFLIETIGPEVATMSKDQIKKKFEDEKIDISILAYNYDPKSKKTILDLIEETNKKIKEEILKVDDEWKEEWIELASEVFYTNNWGISPAWSLTIKTAKDLLTRLAGVYLVRRELMNSIRDVAKTISQDYTKMQKLKDDLNKMMDEMKKTKNELDDQINSKSIKIETEDIDEVKSEPVTEEVAEAVLLPQTGVKK